VIRFLTEVMSGFPFFAGVLIGLGAHSVSFPMQIGGGGDIARSEKVPLPPNWCGYEIAEELHQSTTSAFCTLVDYKYTFYCTNELNLGSDGHNIETNT